MSTHSRSLRRSTNRASYLRRSLVLPAILAATPAFAQYTSSNRDIFDPNTGVWTAGGVTLNGTSFVNLGLQGVGRFAASATDPRSGETIGSFSDLQITGFTKNPNGSYSGVFNSLPDRGYNSGAVFSNYGARINEFDFTFMPYTSSATTTLQTQIGLTFKQSTLFTYDHDNNPATPAIPTTGLVANGAGSLLGVTVPIVTGNTTLQGITVPGRLTVDAEGLAFDRRPGRDGSGWVSDEYGASIYHFNANKELDGVLKVPEALVPHSPVGTVNFQADPPINGRRINQGFEGLTTSPDGTKLFALLQSATLQDSGSGNQGRSNTRLLVYDVSGNNAPNDPIQQYVIQLPRVDDNGATGGRAVNRNAAQSTILALNDHQFLILSRDGNGRGSTGSPVFKSILLADLSMASNFDGFYDFEGAQVAPGGVLAPGITAITWTEALNLLGKLDLSVIELEQFGINLNTAPGNENTFSEKWEALSLVSALDPAAPNDYFLFVANDNDFQTAQTKMFDANGVLQTYSNTLENDTVVLAYRVTIAPVPEASTLAAGSVFALMTGALGMRARRRK